LMRAVSIDGSQHIPLNFNPQRDGWITFDQLVDILPNDSDAVLIASESESHEFPLVYRVDVQRGQTSALAPQPTYQMPWPTPRRALFRKAPARDCTYGTDLNGAVRICVSFDTDGIQRLLYRNDESSPWVELARYGWQEPSIDPLGFTPDNQRLYVL